MSELLFDLPLEKIMDDGTIVLTYDGCIELAKRNKDFHTFFVEQDVRFVKYNRFSSKKVVFFENQTQGYSKQWVLSEEYANLNILTICLDLVGSMPNVYEDRVIREYEEFKKRDMVDLLRFMKFFIDVLIENDIPWGVGRGSSCASLLLYLLGVNRVDPIKYDIPLEEFLR